MQKASNGPRTGSQPAVQADRRGGRTVSRQVLADHVYEELLASLMDGRLEPPASSMFRPPRSARRWRGWSTPAWSAGWR